MFSLRLIVTATLVAALAVPTKADQRDNNWQYTLLFPMIWAPDINGHIKVGENDFKVKVPFDEKIENLDLGLMGEMYVQRGRWLGGFKINYMRSVAAQTTEGITLPGGPALISPHRVKSTTVEGTLDLIVGCGIGKGLTAYSGIRRFGQEFDIKLKSLEDEGKGFNGKLRLVDEWYNDMIVGLSWTIDINERWSLSFAGDSSIVGDSDTNIFLDGRVGYRLNQRNNAWVGYRGSRIKLAPDVDGSRVVTDFRQHGLTVGWAFTF